jgi:hypothetical protein
VIIKKRQIKSGHVRPGRVCPTMMPESIRGKDSLERCAGQLLKKIKKQKIKKEGGKEKVNYSIVFY